MSKLVTPARSFVNRSVEYADCTDPRPRTDAGQAPHCRTLEKKITKQRLESYFLRRGGALTPARDRHRSAQLPKGFRAMSGPRDDERLKALEARIAAAKKAQDPKPHMEEHYSQAHLAWRMVSNWWSVGDRLRHRLRAGRAFRNAALDDDGFQRSWASLPGVKTMIRSAREVERKQQAADDSAAGG